MLFNGNCCCTSLEEQVAYKKPQGGSCLDDITTHQEQCNTNSCHSYMTYDLCESVNVVELLEILCSLCISEPVSNFYSPCCCV